MGFVNMGADNKGMIPFGESLCQFAAQAICFLRGDLAGAEGLAQMVGDHIVCAADFSCVADILLLGIKELRIRNAAVALPACDKSAMIGFLRILYIVDDVLNSGAECAPLSNVQGH